MTLPIVSRPNVLDTRSWWEKLRSSTTDLDNLISSIAEAGLPEPRVEEVVDRLRVTVYVPSHAPEARLDVDGEHPDSVPREQGVSKSSEQVRKVGEQALTLLTLASEDTRSRAELLAGIGLSDAYGNYRRHLLPLIEGGYLARIIPEKPNSQYQRYGITEAGRAMLVEAGSDE